MAHTPLSQSAIEENQEKKETYMSKNLTRKGLALGAVVALSSTLIAGSPAFAASVLFAPTTGTGNTLVAGETFSLTASLSSDLPASNSTQLKFKVANTTGVAATVTINDKTIIAAGTYTAVHGAGYAPVALDASVTGTTSGSTLAAATTSAVFGVTDTTVAEWTTGTQTVAGAVSSATNPTTIKIASAPTTTASYTVTAFLDANNNGAVDTGELSTAQTVNFVNIADSGLTTTFTKPSIGSTAVKAVLAFAADVNVAQLTSSRYAVAYGLYGVSGKGAVAGSTFATTNVGDTVDTYNATDYPGKLISNATIAAPSSGATYSAQPVFGGALVATEVFQVVASASDADATALVVAPVMGDNVYASTASSLTVAGAYKVRAGVTSTAVKATIKKTPTDGIATAVGAGVVVNVTVSGLALPIVSPATTADTITVNGVAVTSTTVSSYATTAVTDATGVVTVPVVTSAGTVGDAITVTLTVPNAVSTATGSVALAWETAAVATLSDLIVGASAVHTAVKGGAYTASYSLRDQFNALYTGSAYRLVYTAPGAAGSTAATSQTVYVPFVNGVATVAITDNSTGAGSNAATYRLQKSTNGLWANDALTSADVASAFTVSAVAPVVAAVTVSAGTTPSTVREVASTFATVDLRVNNTVTAPSGFTANSANTISGSATDASGVGVAGASVTIAAPGVQFVSGSVYAVGSITVVASSAGAYSVTAYSHTAGKVTFTATAGAATKTVAVTYAAVSGRDGTALTLTAPATVLPGRTLTVTGLLVDKFGNPVVTANATPSLASEFTVVYDGPGLVVGSAITATDSTGKFTLRVLLGAADSGPATVTATYGGANGVISSSDVVADADIIKVASISIAAAPVVAPATASAAGIKGFVATTVRNASGKAVTVIVNGRVLTPRAPNSAAQLFRFRAGAGKTTVVVQVDGVTVASRTVTVK